MKLPVVFAFRRFVAYVAAGVFGAVFAVSAEAAVTNVAWYRLGENDAGAAPGALVNNTSQDFAGGNHLQRVGSPLYAGAVSPGASNRVGSSLAVDFNGSGQYLSNTVVSAAVNNFGIEAWVKPAATNSAGFIAFNGAVGWDGWGLFHESGIYRGLFGGLAQLNGGTASPGVWAHVALVRHSGTATLYVNGTAVDSRTNTPNAPTAGFAVGAIPEYEGQPSVAFFNGTIDEVRVFTFAPGQFNTNDLLFNVRRVTTLPVTGLAPPNVTLNALVNPQGLAASAWFVWGPTTNYGNVTARQAVSNGQTNANVSQLIGGLMPGITYHYRAVASNSLGTAFGDDQAFFISGFQSIRHLVNREIETRLTGPANSAYLMEASTNLSHWKLIAALHASNSPTLFQDLEAGRFVQRFYRYSAFRAYREVLFYFLDSEIGDERLLFRHPSHSSTTANFIDTSMGVPNDVRVANLAFSGGPPTNGLLASWVFTNGVVNPWVRLNTFNANVYPNPLIEFSKGLCFDIYADRDFYVALGLRESNTDGTVGANGGTTGPIEWVGGTVNNSVSPPLGRLVTAGKWQRLCFHIPAEPVRAFTGNGVLESTTGKGVFEHLALVPVNYIPFLTNNVYLGNFQTLEPIP